MRTTSAILDIPRHREAIEALCEAVGVERLDVFGSATGSNFGPESDVDVLVRLDRQRGKMFTRYFDLKEGLEEIWGRPVDVVIEDGIRNPYFRDAVERSRVNVFGA